MSPEEAAAAAEQRWNHAARSEFVRASQVIARGRSLIWGIFYVSTSGTGGVNIYDGQDTNGRLKMMLSSVALVHSQFAPAKPWQMDAGIYVEIAAGSPAVLIIFEPIPD